MTDSRKTTPDEVYFVTLTIMGWIDLFSRRCYRDIVVENLKQCQKNMGLEIFVYVVMSNHIHMIARRNGADLNELLGRFKSFTAKKFLQEIEENVQESRKEWLLHQFRFYAKSRENYGLYHVWHYANYATHIYSKEVFEQKRDYIHMNPVRAGLVARPEDYIYSSACADSPLVVDEA